MQSEAGRMTSQVEADEALARRMQAEEMRGAYRGSQVIHGVGVAEGDAPPSYQESVYGRPVSQSVEQRYITPRASPRHKASVEQRQAEREETCCAALVGLICCLCCIGSVAD